MSVYDGMMLTFIVVGIIIVIVSFILTRYDNFIKEDEKNKLEKQIDDLADYDEVRNKILELNEYGEYLKEELEKKHKELLFLYQMILEKQKQMQIDTLEQQVGSVGHRNTAIQENEPSNSMVHHDSPRAKSGNGSEDGDMQQSKQAGEGGRNCNKEILDMSLAGYDISEIAKKLNIGTGQVELVLNLYR